MVARVGRDQFELTEVHRFANQPRFEDGHLRWDFEAIWAEVARGLRRAGEVGPVQSVGIDTWGVDYGLIDQDGVLLADPVCYRDARTEGAPERVWRTIDQSRLYQLTGSQYQRFNTIYQLAAESPASLGGAAKLLLMPDLLSHRLTGRAVAEVTNASTTGLFDVARRDWSRESLDALGLRRELFPDVLEAGSVIGHLNEAARAATGLREGTQVVAVGSHDTASAVAAVPATEPDFAYVSSGTWSLVGIETRRPVLTEASRAANFTNELGVCGTVRYLKNVSGLWLLSECQRTWAAEGTEQPLAELLAGAAAQPMGGALIDADDDRFLAPGDMPKRIAAAVAGSGGRPPAGRHEIVRCIIDSLAQAYARAIRQAEELSGQAVRRVQIVGGGSLNILLCQATADATGLVVRAGPTEASAIGNALMQARALGAAGRSLAELRALVARHFPVTEYQPSGPRGRANPKEPQCLSASPTP
jgi:rhamnulokinase